MWKIDTTISSRRHPLENFADLRYGFLKQWKLMPYAMHYWYFNVIDPVGDCTFSYVLARSNAVTVLNGTRVDPQPDTYTGVFIDFVNCVSEVKQTKVSVKATTLKTDEFDFGIGESETYLRYQDRIFRFNKLLPDSYLANFLGIYEWYSLNCNGDKFYCVGNNAIVRGPLMPWSWLHFYFEDGTHVKVFNALGQRKVLRLNQYELPLHNVSNDGKIITFSAGSRDCYLELALEKGFSFPLTYQPRLSPIWQYDQIGVTLKSVKTNLPGFNDQQKGRGILELTSGFSF
jgi:hypothetical protein